MRKKKHPEHVNHERWLISYADFITLLFAFFVVMFAVSHVDTTQVGRFTESFSRAVGVDMFPQRGHGLMPGSFSPVPATPGAEADSALPEELAGLAVSLQQATAVGSDGGVEGLKILRRRHELVLRLPDGILFDSGNATLKGPAIGVLMAVAAQLRTRPVDIRVEGHTDDRPIRPGASRWQTNWELSTARATAVLRVLADQGGIGAERLAAAGYGEFRPVAGNDTDDGRRQNRRVDLVVSLTVPAESESPATPEGASATQAADGDAGVQVPTEAVPTHAAVPARTPTAVPAAEPPDEHPIHHG